MQTLIQDEDFKPSKGGFKSWLATRKFGIKATGFKKSPGLFTTNNFIIDLLLFLVAIGLETYGLSKIFEYTGDWFVLGGLLLVDIFFAIVAHIPRGAIKRLQNKIWLNEFDRQFISHDSAKVAALKGDIEADKSTKIYFTIWEWLGSAVIIVVCIWKIMTFIGESGYSFFDPNARFIVISYIIVAIIHIIASGYCLSALFTEFFFFFIPKKKHFAYRRRQEETVYNSVNTGSFVVIKSKINLNEYNGHLKKDLVKQELEENHAKPLKEQFLVRDHALLKLEETMKEIPQIKDQSNKMAEAYNLFVLYTWGVLDDTHARKILQTQLTDENKKHALFYCIKKQMEQLNGQV
jgi:hypothetical protein